MKYVQSILTFPVKLQLPAFDNESVKLNDTVGWKQRKQFIIELLIDTKDPDLIQNDAEIERMAYKKKFSIIFNQNIYSFNNVSPVSSKSARIISTCFSFSFLS